MRNQAFWDLLFAVLATQGEAGPEGALWKEHRWEEMDLLGRRGSMDMAYIFRGRACFHSRFSLVGHVMHVMDVGHEDDVGLT